MPASLIVEYFALSGFAAAAVTLATHIITTLAINSLINRDTANPPQAGQSGGKVQLQPATDNKLPVVYGEAWVSPIITDVKISTDQQTMWFVLSLSETTSGNFDFEHVYWDDKLLLFDPANTNTIRGWYVAPENAGAQGTTVTGMAGNISMWFYKNGSLVTGTNHICIDSAGNETQATTDVTAISLLQDAAIDSGSQWGANHTMDNTAFIICKVNYDSAHGIQGISNNIRVQIKNSLTNPADVMIDYLTNDRYGCGVSTDFIDQGSFAQLRQFSDQIIHLINTDNSSTDPFVRYTINGIVNTTQDCLTNLVDMANAADSWVQWNEAAGKWGVTENRSYTETGLTLNDLFSIKSDNIIGGISVSPLDLNNTYNSFKVSFPSGDYTYKGQTDYRVYELPAGALNPNEPNNELALTLNFVNDSRQATYIAYKRLFSSREDLIINFTMDYSGIQIDAGDIIKITHEWYNWTDKLFRVTQVREAKDGSGFLSAQITASSYSDHVYTDAQANPLHVYTQASFSSITDPTYISKPTAPTVPPVFVDTTNSTFVIQGEIPIQGNVIGMEFWYSVLGADWVDNNFTLYTTQYYGQPGAGALYPHVQTDGTSTFFEQVIAVNLPPGTYWFKTRAIGPNSMSEFSDPGPE